MNSVAPPGIVQQQVTFESLCDRARQAVGGSMWVVGEAWDTSLREFPERSLSEFAEAVHLTEQQIQRAASVYAAFGHHGLRQSKHLSWSHFRLAAGWEDGEEILKLANENEMSVREMNAWRRAKNSDSPVERKPTKETRREAAEAEAEAVRETPGAGRSSTGASHSGLHSTPVAAFRKGKSSPPKTAKGNPHPPERGSRRTASTVAPDVDQSAPELDDKLKQVCDILAWEQLLKILTVKSAQGDPRQCANQLRMLADQLDPPANCVYSVDQLEIPEAFNTPECRDALHSWIRFRISIKRALRSPDSLHKQFEQFPSPDDLIAAIGKSIRNEYQGLHYEPRASPTGSAGGDLPF